MTSIPSPKLVPRSHPLQEEHLGGQCTRLVLQASVYKQPIPTRPHTSPVPGLPALTRLGWPAAHPAQALLSKRLLAL